MERVEIGFSRLNKTLPDKLTLEWVCWFSGVAMSLDTRETGGATAGSEGSGSVAVGDESADWVQVVRKHVGSLQYGVIQIGVHDGRVVQIERTERLRLGPRGGGAKQ
jgi:hypothetical protein